MNYSKNLNKTVFNLQKNQNADEKKMKKRFVSYNFNYSLFSTKNKENDSLKELKKPAIKIMK